MFPGRSLLEMTVDYKEENSEDDDKDDEELKQHFVEN
jgi:hypothetical protein